MNLVKFAILFTFLAFKARGLTVRVVEQSSRPQYMKRDLYQTPIYQTDTYSNFFVNISVPSLNITFPVVLDTGSADLWIDQSVFDITRSGTYHSNGTTGFIDYISSSVEGQWGYDTFEIGGMKVNNLSFLSVAKQNTSVLGVLGIGYEVLETTFKNEGYTYNNLPRLLKLENIIDEQLYAFALQDNGDEGVISFGEIDDSQFSGGILYFTNEHVLLDVSSYVAIKMSGLSIDDKQLQQDESIVVLDSGSPGMMVPDYIFLQIMQQIGSQYDEDYGVYLYECIGSSNSPLNKQINFQFGEGFHVTDSVYDFEILLLPEINICMSSIESTGANDSYYLLGSDFLKTVYVIVDQENERVGLAHLVNSDVDILHSTYSGTYSNTITNITSALANLSTSPFVSMPFLTFPTAKISRHTEAVQTGTCSKFGNYTDTSPTPSTSSKYPRNSTTSPGLFMNDASLDDASNLKTMSKEMTLSIFIWFCLILL